MTAPEHNSDVTPITAITADQLDTLDPNLLTPPLVTSDGHHDEIGAAHGRVLPMIGRWRPYVVDVNATKLAGKGTRIYADTADDAVAMLVGGDAPAAIAELRAARDDLGVDPAPEPPPTRDELLLIGADVPTTRPSRSSKSSTLKPSRPTTSTGLGVTGWRRRRCGSLRC